MIQDPTHHCAGPHAAYEMARRAAAHEIWRHGITKAAEYIAPIHIYGGWYSRLFPTMVLRTRETPHA